MKISTLSPILRGHLAQRVHGMAGLVALLCGAFLILSCVSTPKQIEPPIEIGETFSRSGTAPIPDKWWTALEDPRLNSLIEEALKGSFALRAAWDRLDQAAAAAQKNGADLWPSIDGSAGLTRSVTKVWGEPRAYGNAFSLGAMASYELDLWGRVRATRDAALMDALASQEDLKAAALTLSVEITGVWLKLIEQNAQLQVIDAQLKTNEDYLELITFRFRRGQSSATDVLQQGQLVESTRGDRTQIESTIAVLKNQLAVLAGHSPGKLDINVPDALPDPPQLPKTGIPADWIRRRPDVRAAEIRVQASDRRAAAALADRFPKLSLTAKADTTAEELEDLLDNWIASLAANLAAPLFDGNRKKAELERARAALREQLNDYALVLLSSLREVEDALVQEAKQAEYVESLSKQLQLSEKAMEQTRENYTKGGTDFTRYLTTLQSHQRLQRTHIQALGARLGYRISLYRALGGSWELSRPAASDALEMNDEKKDEE